MNKLLIPTAVALLANSCTSPKDDKPNILFVMMDDLGYGHFAPNNDTLKLSNLDPYFVSVVNANKYEPGPPRHKPLERIEKYSPEESIEFSKKATPTLTMLARDGIIFSSAFACNNLSAPSRAGLATGMYPSNLGMYNNGDPENLGIKPGTLLAEKFHDLGYATAHIGKWHIGRQNDQIVLDALKRHGIEDTLGFNQVEGKYPEIYKEISDSGFLGSVVDKDNPLQNGFDYYFGYNYWGSQFYNSTIVWENYKHAKKQKNYNTDVFTDTALSFISKQVKLKKPFYVQLFYHAVHDSLKPKAPDKYFNRFNSESYDLNNFYAHLFAVDENVKRIIEYLDSNGVLKNTIIVFTSDNGAQSGGPSVLPGNSPFPGHKGTYFQGGIRIPLFIYWPEKVKPGLKSNLVVSNVDILPTLIDAAGGKITDPIDGKSLLPILTQQSTEPVHEYLYWAGLHSRYFGFLLNKTFKNDPGIAPYAWAIVKDDYLLRFVGTMVPNVYTDFPDGRQPVYELYNIKNDPSEKHIIENMPEKVNELKLIYYSRAKDFPTPPTKGNIARWEEILPPQSYQAQ
jgi:uncharacterized sulfatase